MSNSFLKTSSLTGPKPITLDIFLAVRKRSHLLLDTNRFITTIILIKLLLDTNRYIIIIILISRRSVHGWWMISWESR